MGAAGLGFWAVWTESCSGWIEHSGGGVDIRPTPQLGGRPRSEVHFGIFHDRTGVSLLGPPPFLPRKGGGSVVGQFPIWTDGQVRGIVFGVPGTHGLVR